MRRIIGIGVAAAVVVTALFYVVLIKPKSSSIATVRDQIVEAEAQEQTLRNQLRQLQDAKARATQVQARLAILDQMLPPDADLPGFIRIMQDAATASSIELTSLGPTRPSALAGTNGVQTVTVTVSFGGTFRRVQDFLSRIESLRRVIEIRSLSLASSIDEETGDTTLTGTLNMIMYVAEPNATVATASGSGAQPSPGGSP